MIGKQEAPRPVGKLLSEVEPESVEWLWPGRLPLGKLAVLDGDPGLGKSAVTLDLAARVSAGLELPDGSRNRRVSQFSETSCSTFSGMPSGTSA